MNSTSNTNIEMIISAPIMNVNPSMILDQMPTIIRSWNKLNEKCKALEESIGEVNGEKEDIKIKLALSRERIIETEKERDRLVRVVEELYRELLHSPLYKIIGKLEVSKNISEQNSTLKSDETDDSPVPKIRSVSNKHVTDSSSNLDSAQDDQPTGSVQNNDSSEINESSTSGNNESLVEDRSCVNPISNVSSTESSDQTKALRTAESDANSDIMLHLSDDENEPPSLDKELMVILPKTTLKDILAKDAVVSVASSDSDASSESPQSCIICDEICMTEKDLHKHLKLFHPNQSREIKKLAIDFREKPKVLPRLRSFQKKSEVSTDSSRIKTENKWKKRRNSKENVEAGNFKKSKKLSPSIKENNPDCDTSPSEAPKENLVKTQPESESSHSSKSPSNFETDPAVEPDQKRWCLICGKSGRKKTLKNFEVLDNHILEKHPETNNLYFRCPYGKGTCRRHFSKKSIFLEHVKLCHQDEITIDGASFDKIVSKKKSKVNQY